jgi:hypothetical protein
MQASCPIAYRLGARALRDAPTIRCTTLYAIGGLYGNERALHAIRRRADAERMPPTLVFNGDFNFFNATPTWWQRLNTEIMERHVATAGNVEVESAAIEPSGNGCGCGYPAYVDPGISERSDRIVSSLAAAAAAAEAPELLAWLRTLPKALVAELGTQRTRVGIVHGDVDSLAGWQLGVEAMEPADEALRSSLGCDGASGREEALLAVTPHERILGWAADAHLDAGLLCSHTCLPYGQLLERRDTTGPHQRRGASGRFAVFNNGSAGMPNFAGTRYGLITRVSAERDAPPPADSLYGGWAGGLRFDALPVEYDHSAWIEQFESVWPPGSDAHVSYHGRLLDGPRGFTHDRAAREGTSRF